MDCRRPVVEHEQAGIALVARKAQTAERPRSGKRAFRCAHLDFDKSAKVTRLPRALDGEARGIFLARAEKSQVIIFQKNSVAESEAMCAASAEMHGALVEQPPGRFSCGNDTRGKRNGARLRLHLPSHCGYSAHALQEIQGQPLQRQNVFAVAFDGEKGITRLDVVAVIFVKLRGDAVTAVQPRRFRQAGRNAVFLRVDFGFAAVTAEIEKLGGQVAIGEILPEQAVCQGADGFLVKGVRENQLVAPEEALLDELGAGGGHGRPLLIAGEIRAREDEPSRA